MCRFLFSRLAAVAALRTRWRGAATPPTPSVSPSLAAYGAEVSADGGSLVVAPAPLGVGAYGATAALLSGVAPWLLGLALVSSFAPPALAQPDSIHPSQLVPPGALSAFPPFLLCPIRDRSGRFLTVTDSRGYAIASVVLYEQGSDGHLYVLSSATGRFQHTGRVFSTFSPSAVHGLLPQILPLLELLDAEPEGITPDDVLVSDHENDLVDLPDPPIPPPVHPPPSSTPTHTLEVLSTFRPSLSSVLLLVLVVIGLSIHAQARAARASVDRSVSRALRHVRSTTRR
jgi:hypothetical protein